MEENTFNISFLKYILHFVSKNIVIYAICCMSITYFLHWNNSQNQIVFCVYFWQNIKNWYVLKYRHQLFTRNFNRRVNSRHVSPDKKTLEACLTFLLIESFCQAAIVLFSWHAMTNNQSKVVMPLSLFPLIIFYELFETAKLFKVQVNSVWNNRYDGFGV